MQFNADLVIQYLTEVLKIEHPDDFKEIELQKDFSEMMNSPKDEWDLEDVADSQLLEIIILEQLLISRCESMSLEEVMDEFYFPHFSVTFFDPEPRPNISIAGWLNYNYGRNYEMDTNHLPPLSLLPVVDIVKALVQASPTCDEMLTEHITDMYLSFRDSEDDEGQEYYFKTKCCDDMYNLSKVLRKVGPLFVRLANNSFEDDLPHSLGQLLLEELREEFLEVFTTDFDEEDYQSHPFLLVLNQVDSLTGYYE